MLAILAPYDLGETTLAACRLADLAVGWGLDVLYLATDACRRGVHGCWDDRVVAPRRFAEAVSRCCRQPLRRLVCFGGHAHHGILRLFEAGCLGGTTRAAALDLVAQWHDLPGGDPQRWAVFDRVLCPHPALYQNLGQQRDLFGAKLAPRLLLWGTGGDPAAARPRPYQDDVLAFGVLCDGPLLAEYPEPWLQVIAEFVQRHQHHQVNLLLQGTLPRRCRQLLRRLGNQHPQVQVRWSLGHEAVLDWLREQDCLIYATPRSPFGFRVAQAAALGVPALCYDLEPFKSLVPLPAWRVPCRPSEGLLGGQRAQFVADPWLRAWEELALQPQRIREASRCCAEGVAAREHYFTAFWRETLLGGPA